MLKIKKLGYIIILLISIFLFSCSSDNLKQNNDIVKDKVNNNKNNNDFLVDENLLSNNINSISSHIRNYGSDGEIKAAEYIKNILQEYEYNVEFQDFKVYKQTIESALDVNSNVEYFNINPHNSEALGNGRNIIAKQKDSDNSKKTLYLTAHYDTTDYTTGVIDNASGSTVILEVARLLKSYNKDFNIGIIFFSAEEYYRCGSKYFISNLSNEEKENILGCVNVDMVGEKDAGDIVMQTVRGDNNIISLMIDKIIGNRFKLLGGGSSDDLSFYMGKIPAITLSNRNSNPNLANEENQLQFIEIGELREVCELIVKFVTKFDISIYNELLEDNKIENKTNENNKIAGVNNFNFIGESQILLENGYYVEIQYTYEDKNNNKYVIKEKDSKFVSKSEYENLVFIDKDNGYGYKIKELKDSNDIKIIFKIAGYYGEIIGDISLEQGLEVLKSYCKFRAPWIENIY